MSLGELVEALAQVPDGEWPEALRTQASFLRELAVRDLVRAESFAEEFAAVCARCGVSQHSTVKAEMNDGVLEVEVADGVLGKVREIYGEDYELLANLRLEFYTCNRH